MILMISLGAVLSLLPVVSSFGSTYSSLFDRLHLISKKRLLVHLVASSESVLPSSSSSSSSSFENNKHTEEEASGGGAVETVLPPQIKSKNSRSVNENDSSYPTTVAAASFSPSQREILTMGPLSMDLETLAQSLNGTGRALLTWDCLRIGIDPTIYFNPQIPNVYLDGSVLSCISPKMTETLNRTTMTPSSSTAAAAADTISEITREDIQTYVPQRRSTQLLGVQTLNQLSAMYSSSSTSNTMTSQHHHHQDEAPSSSIKEQESSSFNNNMIMNSLEYSIASLQQIHISSDGTTKFLIRLASDGALVESVIIPVFPTTTTSSSSSTVNHRHGKNKKNNTTTRITPVVEYNDSSSSNNLDTTSNTKNRIITSTTPRSTLCISSQVGCRQGCTFCATGRMGKLRDLTSDEILMQLYYANKIVRVFQTLLWKRSTTTSASSSSSFFLPNLPHVDNIVFMGMGDASDNAINVLHATKIITQRQLFGLSQMKVTISTVGPTPQAFITLSQASAILAWSVHAVRDSLRKQLVPTTCYSMKELRQGLIQALLSRSKHKKLQTCMWQITLIQHVNDSLVEAEELATFALEMISIIPSMKLILNLIPWNDIGGYTSYQKPSMDRISRFQRYLIDQGLTCYIRTTRGDDESAACGQLVTSKKGVIVH